jgi:hypothetical protein
LLDFTEFYRRHALGVSLQPTPRIRRTRAPGQLLDLSDTGIAPVDYDQTEHAVAMRQFMKNSASLLAELLREDSA